MCVQFTLLLQYYIYSAHQVNLVQVCYLHSVLYFNHSSILLVDINFLDKLTNQLTKLQTISNEATRSCLDHNLSPLLRYSVLDHATCLLLHPQYLSYKHLFFLSKILSLDWNVKMRFSKPLPQFLASFC